MEVFAPILISIQGKWETMLQNIMVIFGFGNEGEFSRDEFHFFLDCLFRGLFKLLIPTTPNEKKSKIRQPPNPGRKLASSDLETLVSQIFPSNIDIVERSDFIEFMSLGKTADGATPTPTSAVKEVCQLLQYMHE